MADVKKQLEWRGGGRDTVRTEHTREVVKQEKLPTDALVKIDQLTDALAAALQIIEKEAREKQQLANKLDRVRLELDVVLDTVEVPKKEGAA